MPISVGTSVAPIGHPISPRSGVYSLPGSAVSTSASLGVGTLRAAPIYVPKRVTLDRIGAEVVVAGDVGSKLRLGIYRDNGNIYPGALLLDAGTINGDSATVQELILPTAVNLLTANQASIETDLTGFGTARSNTTPARSTAQSADGVASLSLTATAGGVTSAITAEGTAGRPVTAGAQYTATASFRAATAGRTARVEIAWYNSSSQWISTQGTNGGPDTTTGWAAVTHTASAPANAAYAAMSVVINDAAQGAGEVHYVDKLGLFAGTQTAGAWALPGSFAGVLVPGVYWLAGAVQNVTTTQPTVRTATEMPYCPIHSTNAVMNLDPNGVHVQGITGALPATMTNPTAVVGMPRIFVRTA